MRRVSYAVSVMLLTTLAAMQPASAAPGDYFSKQHIKSLKVASIAVSDQSCQHINVNVNVTSGVDYVETGFHRSGTEVAHLTIDTPSGSGSDYLQWCPDASLGRYRAGPSQLCFTDAFGTDACFKKDTTTADFYVRRFSRTTVVSQIGSAVTAQVKAYSLSQRRYVGVRDVRVELQSATGRMVDAARTQAGGKATLHGAGVRVVATPTATVAGSHHAV